MTAIASKSYVQPIAGRKKVEAAFSGKSHSHFELSAFCKICDFFVEAFWTEQRIIKLCEKSSVFGAQSAFFILLDSPSGSHV
jgi:hypothetical protein